MDALVIHGAELLTSLLLPAMSRSIPRVLGGTMSWRQQRRYRLAQDEKTRKARTKAGLESRTPQNTSLRTRRTTAKKEDRNMATVTAGGKEVKSRKNY